MNAKGRQARTAAGMEVGPREGVGLLRKGATISARYESVTFEKDWLLSALPDRPGGLVPDVGATAALKWAG